MKLIRLGGTNDALCHFVSFGGFDLLLDCGVEIILADNSEPINTAAPRTGSGSHALRIRLPSVSSVDVASLDALLISNHLSLLALPFLTSHLGFKGTVYATDMAVRYGRILLEELFIASNNGSVTVEVPPTTASASLPTELPCLSVTDIAQCCERIHTVEYNEVTRLPYGVTITSLSSGFSLGSAMWLLESPSERVAYVAAASGDLNRHPKELDFRPLIDCDTLIVTDIKPNRDPHATTERTVEQLLAAVKRVTERKGVCILPMTLAGVFFDLLEAVYAACIHTQAKPLPIVVLSPFANQVFEYAECGAEFLSEKKSEKLYAGEPAFIHEALHKSNSLHVATELTSQLIATLQQQGGVVFTNHPSLRLGPSRDLITAFGHDSRNAVVLVDASLDPHTVLSPVYALEIEKMVCPIDMRLSCGDVNQLIARCCPRNLVVPHEFLVSAATTDQEPASHFSRVFPLHEIVAARPKTELETVAMKLLEPITLDKTNKYIDGLLDPDLAARVMMTEVGGKGAAWVHGCISVKHHEYVIDSLPRSSDVINLIERGHPLVPAIAMHTESKSRAVTGSKRKTPSSSTTAMSPTESLVTSAPFVDYREKSSILLGHVDEDKLLQQIKAHDSHLDVYISQGPERADAMLNIPALDARVTLWKETGKTLIETPKEDARSLLRTLVLAQLHELQ